MKISIYLTASLIFVALILGTAAGYYLAPEYTKEMGTTKTEMGLTGKEKKYDLKYINEMISHHRAAVLMAEKIEKITNRKEIRALAEEIQKNEPALIKELYDWKKAWFNDSKQVEDPKVVSFGSESNMADLRFLNALIDHHEAGIMMAREAQLKSSRAEVVSNADSVENFLTSTLLTLKTWREKWFGVR